MFLSKIFRKKGNVDPLLFILVVSHKLTFDYEYCMVIFL
jgi:hypothetical protein